MIRAADVLTFLVPESKWYIYGNDYEGIIFTNGISVTKEEFEAGFAKYENWKAEQDAKAAGDKAAAEAKLAALGLTTEDLKALGLGTN
jgi:hypothetical protein